MAGRPPVFPPGASRATTLRRWATGTFAGRVLTLGVALKLVAFVIGAAAGSGTWVSALDAAGDISLVVGAVDLAGRLIVDLQRVLLWRVRRKLTLSYVFIGFVPALLIIAFFLLCGVLLLLNVSSYAVRNSVETLGERARFLAETAAVELQHAPSASEREAIVERRQRAAAARHPFVSYALVPTPDRCGGRARAADASAAPRLQIAGPWTHLDPPGEIPPWIPCEGHTAIVAFRESGDRQDDAQRQVPAAIVLRGVAWPDDRALGFAVIVDLPMTASVREQVREETGVTVGPISAFVDRQVLPSEGHDVEPPGAAGDGGDTAVAGRGLDGPLEWLAFIDYTDWATGRTATLSMTIWMSISEMFARISETPVARIGNASFGQVLLMLLAAIGSLFLVIQVVAFAMGLGLARSITGSVHELFVGTERVQRGDFTHKIAIRSRDQLGELAESFNSMTASIEGLLRAKAEKERLEQELRIARGIQMSLLPQGPLSVPGLALLAHCEPAREVGGDYYDCLPIDDHRLGVLIADVAGKGTSAALYMAELKGIVLSLSQRHSSPRELLIDANTIISRHLDARSFITITYAVVDLRERTLTHARAGHCPLIYVPGPYASARAPQILAPDGLVLGLRIDEGQTFNRLLQQETLALGQGDLFVLYTDGITEAMNAADDCFGEARLAQLVHQHADLPLPELRERILREVRAFAGSTAQQDDMTMLLMKVEES